MNLAVYKQHLLAPTLRSLAMTGQGRKGKRRTKKNQAGKGIFDIISSIFGGRRKKKRRTKRK